MFSEVPSFVAFSASRTDDLGPVSGPTIIQFPVVSLNHGDGYNSTSSMFTAPVSGVYWVYMTVLPPSNKAADVKIRTNSNNGSVVVSCFGNMSSVTCGRSVYLAKGDIVYVQLWHNHGAHLYCHSDAFCVFSSENLLLDLQGIRVMAT